MPDYTDWTDADIRTRAFLASDLIKAHRKLTEAYRDEYRELLAETTRRNDQCRNRITSFDELAKLASTGCVEEVNP